MRYLLSILIFLSTLDLCQCESRIPEARKISVAFDQFPNPLQLLSDDPASRVLRSLVAQPLFRGGEDGKIVHILTDGLSRDSRNGTLSVRLRKKIHFSNGRSIEVVDILDSFKRCREKAHDANIGTFTSRMTLFSDDVIDTWLDFHIENDEASKLTVTFIENCPILDSGNGVIFGEEFGVGSNIIAAGEFYISNFKSGMNYTLSRSSVFPERKGAPEIEVVHATEPRKSLSLLRSGSIDALITDDKGSIDSALEDSTLQIEPCYGKTLIKRRTLRFFCPQSYELKDVGYAIE